ncbi:unnamed protein product [Acanthoscelides obtectus]|uniref:Uncharacterized protein n=1 Tax=Acanthoscelides obtectus TaxID=200917 RepID=A0A9P0QI83_ACAOB|nr:unnamed protein product [Acanthoscelides obtectus]CAK1634050.1 hypothetical protein AOBTE_LOCUS8564 [Acanthoscelides obtectus]
MFISSVMLSLLPPNICRTSKLRLVYPGCIGHHKMWINSIPLKTLHQLPI